jgi:hypothetical protein
MATAKPRAKAINAQQQAGGALAGTQIRMIEPKNIEFDPANPRFGKAGNKPKSQPELYDLLLQDPHNATALVDSFVENGYVAYEPLIVKSGKPGKFLVLEGNRRLAAVKYIQNNKDKYEAACVDALNEVPCLVFPSNAPDRDVRTYLGIRHLLGFREWPALSKAVFLEQEVARTGDLNKLLREISVTKQNARRFLVPYRLFTELKQQLPEGEDFWVFAEAIQRGGIKKFIQLDVDSDDLSIKGVHKGNLIKLLDMLYGPRSANSAKRDASRRVIQETRDLTKLGKVLDSDIASEQLERRKNLEDAYLYIDSRVELIAKFERLITQAKVVVERLKPKPTTPEFSDLSNATSELDKAFKKFKSKKNV